MNVITLSIFVSTTTGALLEGKLVGLVQQFDGPINIGRPAEVKAHPTTVGQDMVGFGSAGAYNENIALADLDADGRAEIIGPSDVHYIEAYLDRGTQIREKVFDSV